MNELMRMIKYLVMIVVGSFVLAMPVFGQQSKTASEYAIAADELFRDSKFKEALILYGELQNPTAHAYANMGSCSFELGDFGKALWRWRQAEKKWGLWGRGDLYHNIDLARQKLSGSSTKKQPTLQRFHEGIDRLCRSIPLIGMQLFFLLAWAVLFLYARRLLKRRCKKTIFGLFLLVVACGGVLVYRHNLLSHTYAVVLEASSELYSGPGLTYQKLGHLKNGDEIRIETQERDFYKVSASGRSGWILRGNLGII